MNETIVIILVEAIFLVIIAFILYVTTKKINLLLKKIFVGNLKEFDYLVEEREKKTTELNEEIYKKSVELKRIEEEIENTEINENTNDVSNNSVVVNNIDFEDDDVIQKYKDIKESLNFDRKAKILQFIEEHKPVKEVNYDTLNRVRSYFTYDVIFRLSSFDNKTQLELIQELLTPEEYEIVSEYIGKRFKIEKFINRLDNYLSIHDNYVYVYVGNKNENYDGLNEFVRTKYDKHITEGIRIVHKGIIYDYSI